MADMGRPRIELDEQDWSELDEMAKIQCTGEEMAGVLGMCYDTLESRIKEKRGVTFSEWYKKASAGGKKSLRRRQFESSDKGNITMQIWLGKQYLGQSDKNETKIESKGRLIIETPDDNDKDDN